MNITSYVKGLDLTAKQLPSSLMTGSRKGAPGFIKAKRFGIKNNASI